VPVAFALAVAWHESGWRPGVVSSAGAVGVMQLTPPTADWVGASMLGQRVDLYDARSNVQAGITLLKHYLARYNGDRSLVLAAYYQGQTAADRYGVYAMTRPYIASILALEAFFAG
jgi:soluble lytic murein transglycosylase-like protein